MSHSIQVAAQAPGLVRNGCCLLGRACVYAGLIEHAAWTKGDAYLDKPMKSMHWHQQLLLDVVAVLAMITAGLAVLVVLVVKYCSMHLQRHAKLL